MPGEGRGPDEPPKPVAPAVFGATWSLDDEADLDVPLPDAQDARYVDEAELGRGGMGRVVTRTTDGRVDVIEPPAPDVDPLAAWAADPQLVVCGDGRTVVLAEDASWGCGA